jgi:hypothetical protein
MEERFFEYALREENSSLLFNKAAAARGEPYSAAESLFMALIFQQQKMISQLIEKPSKHSMEMSVGVLIQHQRPER